MSQSRRGTRSGRYSRQDFCGLLHSLKRRFGDLDLVLPPLEIIDSASDAPFYRHPSWLVEHDVRDLRLPAVSIYVGNATKKYSHKQCLSY